MVQKKELGKFLLNLLGVQIILSILSIILVFGFNESKVVNIAKSIGILVVINILYCFTILLITVNNNRAKSFHLLLIPIPFLGTLPLIISVTKILQFNSILWILYVSACLISVYGMYKSQYKKISSLGELLTVSGKYDKEKNVWYINNKIPEKNNKNNVNEWSTLVKIVIFSTMIINLILMFITRIYEGVGLLVLASLAIFLCLIVNSLVGIYFAIAQVISDIERRDGVSIKL
jgi:hypothetical protein